MDKMTVSMLLDVTMGPPGEKLITWKRERKGDTKRNAKGGALDMVAKYQESSLKQ